MVVRSLDIEKDPFRPREEEEEILRPHYPYLSAIGALMYLANSTRPHIAFSINLLARHSAAPTKHHWVGVKTTMRYLNGTKDLGLLYNRNQDPILLGYTYVGDGGRSMYLPAEWGPRTRETTLLGDSATTTRRAGLGCA